MREHVAGALSFRQAGNCSLLVSWFREAWLLARYWTDIGTINMTIPPALAPSDEVLYDGC
jgi:hypothetical protein